MKLRALSCNKTVLRKDIFRFTPLWAIYLIGGLLVMLTSFSGTNHYDAHWLSGTMGPFAIINLIYAVLTAQMLFGDLYKSRLCNALHALPMPRETWFCTHTVAGLIYSIVPHLIGAIFFMPMLGQYSWVALAWVATMLMQYLFFFGVAVFCVMCTGNRFAQVAVYAILNFLAMILYWFITVIYEPMLYGVEVSEDIFVLLCPVVKMAGSTQLLKFEWVIPVSALGAEYYDGQWTYMGPGEGWGYLGICAGIGVGLLVAALLLYRRRKLESAGEFIAIEALKPVFSVVFALCIGAVVAALGQSIDLTDGYLLFLVVGLFIGWFGGQMLLQRTVRVFKGKAFAGLAILGLALALTVGMTAWDPVGITRYIPDAEDIQTVEMDQGWFYSYSESDIQLGDEDSIRQIRDIHQQILQERNIDSGNYRTYSIRYTLKSGRQITRIYPVYDSGNATKMIRELYNKPQILLGETDREKWLQSLRTVSFCGYTVKEIVTDYNTIHKEDLQESLSYSAVEDELLVAIWADAAAGKLETMQVYDKEYSQYYVSFDRMTASGRIKWSEVYIPSQAENCQEWIEKYEDVLKAHGIHS